MFCWVGRHGNRDLAVTHVAVPATHDEVDSPFDAFGGWYGFRQRIFVVLDAEKQFVGDGPRERRTVGGQDDEAVSSSGLASIGK